MPLVFFQSNVAEEGPLYMEASLLIFTQCLVYFICKFLDYIVGCVYYFLCLVVRKDITARILCNPTIIPSQVGYAGQFRCYGEENSTKINEIR